MARTRTCQTHCYPAQEKVKMQSVRQSSFLVSDSQEEAGKFISAIPRRTDSGTRLYISLLSYVRTLRVYRWHNGDYIPAIEVCKSLQQLSVERRRLHPLSYILARVRLAKIESRFNEKPCAAAHVQLLLNSICSQQITIRTWTLRKILTFTGLLREEKCNAQSDR